ncbi:helix-turn-helix domain-containing protein [Limosilactobacillus agrestimuris]|uniref:helix-turn-helix domain-containing protein n=1 Tax=Limosilactobacillus agrestimuris TaxID=2941331 RepID=UPI00203EA8F0|nr:helix-turn-helix domain-containing protein [Limosilactobacillus agrestimuris]
MIGDDDMESLKVQLPNDLQEATKKMIADSLNSALKELEIKNSFPPYMNKTEARKYLHISSKTLLDWETQYDDIPIIVIDGIQRYKRTDLDEWMQQHRLNK